MGSSVSAWGNFDGGDWDILIGGGGKIEERCPFPPQWDDPNPLNPSKVWLASNGPNCAPFPCKSTTTTEFTHVQTDPNFTEIRLGQSVAFLGDLDGDLLSEIAMGAPLWSSAGKEQCGSVYIVFSSTTPRPPSVAVEVGLPSHRGLRIRGEAEFDWFGYAVSGGGDIDGDTVPDLLVGAPTSAHKGQNQPGSAYVISGAYLSAMAMTAMTGPWPEIQVVAGTSNTLRIDGVGHQDRLGYSICGIGDLNSDGRREFAVGAVQVYTQCSGPLGNLDSFKPANSGTGYVDVWAHNGSSSAPALNLIRRIDDGEELQGAFDDGDQFGKSLCGFGAGAGAPGGDVNGDGFPDLAVGAPYWDIEPPTENIQQNQGRVVVYSGAWILDPTSIGPPILFERHVAAIGERYGWAVAGVTNGLPVGTPARLAVSSRNYGESPVACAGSNRGITLGAYLLYCLPDGTLIHMVRGRQDRERLGFALAFQADMSISGPLPEIVAGAHAWAPVVCTACQSGCCSELGAVLVLPY